MSQCPYPEDALNAVAGDFGKQVLETVTEEVVRGGKNPADQALLHEQMSKVTHIVKGDAVDNMEKIITRGPDELRVPFKNIEGFVEGNENINYLTTLHTIDGDTLYDTYYEASSTEILSSFNSANYNRSLCTEYSDKAIIDICNNEMNDYNYHYNILKQNINNYTSLYDYQMYLGGIINERINFLERIKNKINTYKQNIFTDNRKNSYLSSNLEFYKNIHFYIFILYYAIFIVFLIFSNFIKDKLYENKYVIIYVLIILIIPFILRYILLYIYNLYISYIEKNYLKLDEISYKYLVEETDQQINNKKDKQQLDNYHARRNGN